MEFKEEYEKLNECCKEVNGFNIDKYIKYIEIINDNKYSSILNQEIKKLKHYQGIAKKLENKKTKSKKEPYKEEDIEWIKKFTKKIKNQKDYFSLYKEVLEEIKFNKIFYIILDIGYIVSIFLILVIIFILAYDLIQIWQLL